MVQLPPVSESTDVPTSFGTVRAYRFDGPSAGPPVVLLPGRNASTPMWRVNIPALLEQRTVIGIDLLGEAGMSVQSKPCSCLRECSCLCRSCCGAGCSAGYPGEPTSMTRCRRPH
jgi:pimeloyl-ACP methyl ester carboxylesterase